MKDANIRCLHTYTCEVVTGLDPLSEGHFEDGLNSTDLFFVERFSSFGCSKCTVGIILGL